jgi:hypothetical protein
METGQLECLLMNFATVTQYEIKAQVSTNKTMTKKLQDVLKVYIPKTNRRGRIGRRADAIRSELILCHLVDDYCDVQKKVEMNRRKVEK